MSTRVDVGGILERAGADPAAPDGSQAWALAQVSTAIAELIDSQRADARLVAVLLSYLNDNLSEREKARLGAELMTRDLSDHVERRAAALARVGGAK